MTLIEALRAALESGCTYCSNDESCDMLIMDEIQRIWRNEPTENGFDFQPETNEVVREGGDMVYLCQTADEVYAEQEDEDDEIPTGN